MFGIRGPDGEEGDRGEMGFIGRPGLTGRRGNTIEHSEKMNNLITQKPKLTFFVCC